MPSRQVLRILDANFNRSREGLRVCEEISRFVLNRASLTSDLKSLRHSVTRALKDLPFSYETVVAARDSIHDVGRKTTSTEKTRTDFRDLFLANMERVKESLRVLEETSKIIDPTVSERLKRTRFKAYTVEKNFLTKRGRA